MWPDGGCQHFSVILSAVHGFLNATYGVLEGDRVNTIFQANVKGMTSFVNVPLLGTIMGNSISAGTVSNSNNVCILYVIYAS